MTAFGGADPLVGVPSGPGRPRPAFRSKNQDLVKPMTELGGADPLVRAGRPRPAFRSKNQDLVKPMTAFGGVAAAACQRIQRGIHP